MFLADTGNPLLRTLAEKAPGTFQHCLQVMNLADAVARAVDADVAVISCGKNNSYGHPHKEALDYINANAMTSLRTDEMGDIVFKVTADGYSLVE